MSFLYFIEGPETMQIDLKKFGLEYAFEGSPIKGYNTAGFEEKGGIVLGDRSAPSKVRIDQEKQTWRKFGDVWIGMQPDATPESLKRKATLKGRDLDINGQLWHIPTAVSFDELDGELQTQWHLSRVIDLDETGEFCYGDVEAQFAPLFDAAMSAMGEVTYGEIWNHAATALGYNYRIGKREAVMLKLLTDKTAFEIIDIVVDASSIPELQGERDSQKKSQPSDELTMTAGVADAIGTTSQLLPT